MKKTLGNAKGRQRRRGGGLGAEAREKNEENGEES